MASLSTYTKQPGTMSLQLQDLSAAPPAVKLEHQHITLAAPRDAVSKLLVAREQHSWIKPEFSPAIIREKPALPMVVAQQPATIADTRALPDIMAPIVNQPSLRDDERARYVRQFEQLNHNSLNESLINALPSYSQQLAWVNTIENPNAKLWFHQLAHVVAVTGKEFPETEVLSREYIAHFLRAPFGEWERPCCGIIDPKTMERLPCESVLMKGGGFVCRELLMPSVFKRVLRAQCVVKEARSKRVPIPVESTPNLVLPREQQLCFLCHLRVTNIAYFRANVFEDERLASTAADENKMRIINGFCVIVNKIGEYNINTTLPGFETHPCGLSGPFPAYQRDNFVPHVFEGGIKGWLETDKVVF